MRRSRRSLLSLLSLTAVTVFLNGCIAHELRVANHTGGAIQFYTGHTKKTVRIPSCATVIVPHTAGRVIIITQQDDIWEYAAVDLPDFSSDTIKGFKRVTLPVTVEPNGVITLPSGRKVEPTQKMSPK